MELWRFEEGVELMFAKDTSNLHVQVTPIVLAQTSTSGTGINNVN